MFNPSVLFHLVSFSREGPFNQGDMLMIGTALFVCCVEYWLLAADPSHTHVGTTEFTTRRANGI
jgi:hypothetical protein